MVPYLSAFQHLNILFMWGLLWGLSLSLKDGSWTSHFLESATLWVGTAYIAYNIVAGISYITY